MVAVGCHAARVAKDVAVAGPELNSFTVALVVLDGPRVAWREVLALCLDSQATFGDEPFELTVDQLEGGFINLLRLMIKDEDVCA